MSSIISYPDHITISCKHPHGSQDKHGYTDKEHPKDEHPKDEYPKDKHKY